MGTRGDSSIVKSLLVFVSAFLLFVVQPMAGKGLLPRWGGAANVWTACLLFFQVSLLIGYAYAYVSVRFLSNKGQAIAQGALMLSAMVWLLIPWSMQLEIGGPAISVLASLAISLALPTIALSSASPIASHWTSTSMQGREPYYLYSISNAGSLLGCLAYPFAIEPWFGLQQQQWGWRAIYGCLALGWLFACAASYRAAQPIPLQRRQASSKQEGVMTLWLALPFSTAIILAASTHHMSQAGVVVPGLWVIPLAIYLATWWVAFRGWGPKRWGGLMTMFYVGAFLALSLIIFKLWLPWIAIIAGYFAVVFCTGIACHSLLYEVRPAAERLTGYYFAISVGGAMGTAATLLVGPVWFTDYYELHVGLAIAALAVSSFFLQQLTARLGDELWVRRWKWPMNLVLPCVLIGSLWTQSATPSIERIVEQQRDFYGVVQVVENSKLGYRAMVLGQTIHGVEPLSGPLDVDQSMYYGTRSGVALAWGWTRDRWKRPLRVGAIGLGTGTMSLYASREDQLVYYEISPAVRELAQKHFHYLAAHQGATDIRIGDGRTLIASEAASGKAHDEPMDLLLVDAFTNDSLPMHLLTLEAIQTYSKRLTSEGLIAFNITNRNLDLAPILNAAAMLSGYQAVLIENPIDRPGSTDFLSSARTEVRWLLFVPKGLEIPAWPGMQNKGFASTRAWTDSHGSLLQAFRY
jgi:spermidine synthase